MTRTANRRNERPETTARLQKIDGTFVIVGEREGIWFDVSNRLHNSLAGAIYSDNCYAGASDFEDAYRRYHANHPRQVIVGIERTLDTGHFKGPWFTVYFKVGRR